MKSKTSLHDPITSTNEGQQIDPFGPYLLEYVFWLVKFRERHVDRERGRGEKTERKKGEVGGECGGGWERFTVGERR